MRKAGERMTAHNAKDARNQKVFEAYQMGMSYEDIGTYFLISKQAAHQIVQREIRRRKNSVVGKVVSE